MSISSQITRLQNAKAAIKTAIENKGVSIPASVKLDTLNTYINSIASANEVINVSITVADTGTVTLYDNDAGEIIDMKNFSSATSFSFSVTGGINYTISITGNKAYSPSSYTYIAHSGNIRNIVWEGLITGVFIKYTDGSLSAYNSLSSGKTPVGVGLATSNVFLLIHPDEGVNLSWGGQGILIDGCFTTDNEATAKTDFNGKANTEAIIAQLGAANAPMANWARNTCTYADGSIGWLPSCGEMEEIRLNESNVNTAMSLIGGTLFNFETDNKSYYSSTQVRADRVWYWYWHGGVYSRWDPLGKSYSYTQVRSVSNLV